MLDLCSSSGYRLFSLRFQFDDRRIFTTRSLCVGVSVFRNSLKMGGCCSSSKKVQLQGTPVYYYCQPTSEEQRTFHSYNGSASALAAGFFVGLNLDTSIPDTYRPPPAPIPFSVLFGRPHSPLVTLGSQGRKLDAAEGTKHSSGTTGTDCVVSSASEDNVNISDCKTLAGVSVLSHKEFESANLKTSLQNIFASEEEDCCPICLEDYDADNPKWVTNCKHEYHLSCILEWKERSDQCPVCDKKMTLYHTDKIKMVSSNTSSLYSDDRKWNS
ncbi:hypothetical protein V2J09_001511 [Rumex salicifolius]